ncbi:class I SAM-dependent methyltransferase [Azospirillum brasilense]|uniref:Class I SAM-dependent methyltransferase n=2 Tax=Azospirillum brasilense TaxID=192 RepID=A0A6L3AV48_AZOBR|nr:class I SAM-dependent methyltransferase [Azospirillum brasilense]
MNIGADIDKNLGVAELAELFGGSPDEVSRWCAPFLDAFDFRYTELAGAERDAMLLEAVKRLEPNAVSVAGQGRKPDWEAGWSENLTEFLAGGHQLDALVPKYIRPNEVVRLFGQYARPRAPHFIRNYTKTYRAWLAQRFFADAAAIYEFGCGPGSHVAYFAETFPEKPVVGLDWAAASVNIMEAIAGHYGWKVSGHRFDFFAPDHGIRLPEGTAVLTFGALEQVGTNHGPFLDYLLANKPLRCVHVEGINELYDEENLLDRLALRYHQQRNYLSNLLTRLQELEKAGRVVIESVHRQRFGTRFNDTFSHVVWRPA